MSQPDYMNLHPLEQKILWIVSCSDRWWKLEEICKASVIAETLKYSDRAACLIKIAFPPEKEKKAKVELDNARKR